ncbi:MAG TPA: asparaginase, partial [Cytophagaceae bacterium]
MFDRNPLRICTNTTCDSLASILLIYTGGTLGMAYNKQGKILQPFDFHELLEKVPELSGFDLELHIISLEQPIDSSNMQPSHWLSLAQLIGERYNDYDGFVILHGTDTMAYTASALSYLLEGLNKPVILTGAQLPIGVARTDARENIITSIEIASAKRGGRPILSEVAIYFDNFLLRGNRSKKVQSSHFNAFVSENYPPLGEAGAEMEYNSTYLAKYEAKTLKVHQSLCDDVAVIQLFPGLSPKVIESILEIQQVKAIIVETYGSGNAPDNP